MRSRLTFLLIGAALLAVVFLWFLHKGEPKTSNVASTLTFRTELSTLNLDPRTMADIESRKIATLLHAGLVAVNLDGEVEPRLASAWKRTSTDTWLFTLRNDVRFSDGQRVDAQTVVESLCSAMQPISLWAWSLSSISHKSSADGASVDCTGLSAPSSSEVEIRQTEATSWLLEALAGPAGWIVPNSDQAGEFGLRPGIGPYSVASFKPDSMIVLAARHDGGSVVEPKVDRVVFRYLPDPAVAARAFEAGDIDLLRIDSPQMYSALVQEDPQGNRSLRVSGTFLSHAFSRIRVIIVNEAALARDGATPEDIAAFRKAYSSAVDRIRLTSTAPGRATPLLTAFPPASGLEINAEQSSPPSAPIQTLEGKTISLLVNNDPYSDLIAAQLPTDVAGVHVRYRAVDFGVIINALQKGEQELVGVSLDATIDSPEFWRAFFTPGAPFLLFGKSLSGLSEDQSDTVKGLADTARQIDENGNWIPLYQEEGMLALGPRLTGLRLTKSGQVSLELVGVREDQ